MSTIVKTPNLNLIGYSGETIPTYLRDWSRNMEIIDENFGKAVTELPSIDARLETLEEDVQTTMTTVHEHIATFTAYQVAIDGRIDDLDQRVGDLTPAGMQDMRDRITTAEQNIISNAHDIQVLEERISNDEDAIADNKASIEALSRELEEVDLTPINNAIEQIRGDLDTAQGQIDTNTGDIGTLKGDTSKLEGEVDGLQASDLAQAKQISMLGEDTKDLEVRVARLERGGGGGGGGEIPDLTELEAKVASNTNAIGTIQTEQVTQNNNIQQNSAAIAEVKSMQEALIEEVNQRDEVYESELDSVNTEISNLDLRVEALEAGGGGGQIPDLSGIEERLKKLEEGVVSGEFGVLQFDIVAGSSEGGFYIFALMSEDYTGYDIVGGFMKGDNGLFHLLGVTASTIYFFYSAQYTVGKTYPVTLYYRKKERVVTKEIPITVGSNSGVAQYYTVDNSLLPPVTDIIRMSVYNQTSISFVSRYIQSLPNDNILTLGALPSAGDISFVIEYIEREP